MNRSSLAAALTVAAVAVPCASSAALAGSPASDAAHLCLEGAQIDYYQVAGESRESGDTLDFGGLAHGADSLGPFVVAENHGECVSFIARNNKGKGKSEPSKPTESVTLSFTSVTFTD